MVKLRCLATCYMSSDESHVMERYENEPGEEVYSIPEGRVQEFLDTGNFELV